MLKYAYSAAMFVIFILANVATFMISGLRHDLRFWESYAFVLFAYITLWFSAFRQDDSSMEYLFAITRIRLNIAYVFCAFVAACVVNYFVLNTALFLTVQFAVAAVFIVAMVFLTDADEQYAEKEKRHVEKRAFVSEAKVAVQSIRRKTMDEDVRRHLDKVLDKLSSAQDSDGSALSSYEADFLDTVSDLESNFRKLSKDEIISLVDYLNELLDSRDEVIGSNRNLR